MDGFWILEFIVVIHRLKAVALSRTKIFNKKLEYGIYFYKQFAVFKIRYLTMKVQIETKLFFFRFSLFTKSYKNEYTNIFLSNFPNDIDLYHYQSLKLTICSVT